jgi:putative endonuclease
MDSIRASEAPDPGSIPGEATKYWNMYFAYVLKSVSHDYFYKGHCSDIAKRVIQHNSGKTESIRPYIPFALVYFEAFETEREAITREKYFKSAAGRRFLKNKLAS